MRFFPACLLVLLFALVSVATTSAQTINDIGVSAIDSPASTFCGARQSIYARVTNYGLTPVDSFVLHWSLNGTAQTPVNCLVPLDTIGGAGPVEIHVLLGLYAFPLNAPVTIKAWTSMPNGRTDSTYHNDSASATRTALSLKGDYTIDPAGSGGINFATITDAIAALNTYGVCGPVTFNIAPGTYTRTTAVTVGIIAGASAVNRITFKGSGPSACVFRGNIANSGIIVANQSKYITFRDLGVMNESTAYSSAIAVVGSSNQVSIVNCNITMPLISSGLLSSGIIFTGTAGGTGIASCMADSILIDSNTITGGNYGIIVRGQPSMNFNRSIIVSNNTVSEANETGIYLYNIYNPLTVTRNTVSLRATSTLLTSGILFADNVNTSATKPHNISQNRVFGFRRVGILCSNHSASATTPPTAITNNLVVGESTDYTGNITGINITQAVSHTADVYHNTVVVRASATVNQSGAAAFFSQGSASINVKNNVFVVTGGLLHCVYVSPQLAANRLNHNLYHHPDPAWFIVRQGTFIFSPATFRTPLGGGDSSYFALPVFDISGADTFALNQACLLGTNLGLKVPYDFNGKLRDVRPTVGAYEFTALPDNLSVLDIIAPKTAILPGANNLKYRVMNTGRNPVARYRASYYSGSDTARSIVRTDTLFPCAIDTATFTGLNQLNVTDSLPVTFYTSRPNDTTDSDRSGDTLRVVFRTALKGVYTVGGLNPDFTTPQEATAALTARGIRGHVRFDIRPGTYTGQVTVASVAGVSDTATIIFDGHHADSVLISADVTGGAFQVMQTGYVTVKNLSVTNAQESTGILLHCPAAQRMTRVAVTGCNIFSPLTGLTGKAGFVGINVTGTSNLVPGNTGCDSLLIDSNTVTGFNIGIWVTGRQDTLHNMGVRVTRNRVTGSWASGITVNNVYNPVVLTHNRVANKTFGSGILFTYNRSYHTTQPHVIAHNKIHHFGTHGISCQVTAVNATAAPALIVNNEVYSAANGGVTNGISVDNNEGPARAYVYNNTVVMRGTSTSAPRAGVYTRGSVNTEIRNNVLAVFSGAYFPVYLATSTPGKVVNYNLYYNKTSNILGYRNGSNFIAAPNSYRNGSTGGDSSANALPPFYSIDSATLDLSLRHKCFGSGINMPFLGFDIDSTPRTLPVTVGAYEARTMSTALSLDTIFSPGAAANLQRGIYDVKFQVRNTGTDTVTQYQAAYVHNNSAPVVISRTVSLPSCAPDTVIFTGAQALNLVATNELKGYVYSPDNATDPFRADDTIVRVLLPPMRGLYAIGGPGSDFATLGDAFAAAIARTITGPVEFRLSAGEYSGPFTLNSTIPGHNSTNRVTVSGIARDSVKIGADTLGPVVTIQTMKYVTLKDLTIKNTQAGIGVAVIGSLGNNATTGCTIKNCRIELPDSGSGTATNAGIRVANNINTVANNSVQLDSLTIDSNSIRGGSFGIVMYGVDNALHNRKIAVTGNTVDTVLKTGIHLSQVRNAVVISLNTVNKAADRGIYLYSQASAGTHYITRNRVYNFGHTGISVSSPVSSTAAKTEIVNNIVVSADSAQAENGLYGIHIYHNNSSDLANVYHNTVVMRGTSTSYITSALYSYGSNQIAVKNNIFAVYSGNYSTLYMSHGSSNVNANVYYIANALHGRLYGRNNGDFDTASYIARGGWGSSIQDPDFSGLHQYIPDLQPLSACAASNALGSGEVPADIYGMARSPWPTSGAIEAVPGNISARHILKFAAPVVAGAQELKMVVKNVSTETISSFQAGYIHNGMAPVIVNQTMSIAPCSEATVTFSGSHQPTLASVNDFTAFVSNPNGIANSYAGDDTVRKHVLTALSGTYTIGGATPDFSTFADAVNALESGLVGPVKFAVRPGTYTDRIVLYGKPVGGSKTNSITFEGTDAESCVLKYPYPGATVELNRVSDVNFRKLTLEAAQTGVIRVQAADTIDNGSNMSIRHCVFKLPALGYSSVPAIYFSAPSTEGCLADSLLIDSNRFSGGGYALDFIGAADVTRNKGFVISNNQVDSCANTGFQFTDLRNAAIVTANTINLEGTSYTNGIVFTNSYNTATNGSHVITRNKINNFREYGISVHANDPPVPNTLLIANNAVTSSADVQFTIDFTGIRVRVNDWNSTVMVYHNSVVMQGKTDNPVFSGMYVDADNYYIKNNIIAVYNGATVPLYLQRTVSGRVNYNVYYNNSPMGTRKLVRNGSNLFDSTNYRTRSLGGDSSFSYAPPFVNYGNLPADLRLAESCSMTTGVNLSAWVPADMDGKPRPAAPRPGAYEFTGLPNNLLVKSILSPLQSNTITSGLHQVKYQVINYGINPVTQYTAGYFNNNGAVESKTRTVSLAPCATDIVEFTGAQRVNLGLANELTVFTSNPNGVPDSDRNGDTLRTTIVPPMSGDYIVGPAPSDFTTLADAVARLEQHGAGGAVTVKIKTGTYYEYLHLDSIRGASASNTITFTSLDGSADSVMIFQTNWDAQVPLILGPRAKYFIFDKLKFRSDVADNIIRFSGDASFDTIRNCIISQTPSAAASKIVVLGDSYSGNGMVFTGSTFEGGYYALSVTGVSRANPARNLVVSGNTFIESRGLFQSYKYCRGGEFSRNTVNQNLLAYPFEATFSYVDSGFKMVSNRFEGFPGKVFMIYLNNSQNDSLNRGIAANNLFQGGAGFGFGAGTSNLDVVHNTVYGEHTKLQVDATGSSRLRFMNNIVAGSWTSYELLSPASPASFYSDYNSVTSYMVSGSELSPQQFRAAYPSLEANSVSASPGIMGLTDLRPDPTHPTGWLLNGTGAHIGYAWKDLAGNSRPQTFAQGAPDIGAFEFTPASAPPGLTAVPPTPAANTTQTFLLGFDTVARISWGGSVPATITGRLYTGAYPPGTDTSGARSLKMYWDFDAPAGTYDYSISLYYRSPLKGTVSRFGNMIGAKKEGASPWAYYASPVSVIDSARKVLTINNLTGFSLFTGTDLLKPLPVELLKIDALAQGDDVRVLWSTAEEKNASHFELYGSDNGTDYTLLGGPIAAHGNSSVVRNYAYTNYLAFKNSPVRYYRLKSADLNGDYCWSNTVMAAKSNSRQLQASIYPNPFGRSISLVVPTDLQTTVSISTLQGQVLFRGAVDPDNGMILITDLDHLAAGAYFIRVEQGSFSATQKLIKQ